ncbi:hypothetical protein M8J75_005901 [Diaphorina citri]|nr:hypothetical protein M8J75_005901 [Diaphorina citri]
MQDADIEKPGSVTSKKPPIPLPRKKSSPDINDPILQVVHLSSDEESSQSPPSHNVDTDVSDIDPSPKRLQRSGTFTKLDSVITVVQETKETGNASENSDKENEEENKSKTSNDMHNKVVNRTNQKDSTSEDSPKKDQDVSKSRLNGPKIVQPTVDHSITRDDNVNQENLDFNVREDENKSWDGNVKNNVDVSGEGSGKVNEIFTVASTSAIPNLEPLADSTDFSEDVRSLSAQRKKRKKKLTKKSKHQSAEETELKPIKPEQDMSKYDDEHVVCICIHESDLLLTDGQVLKPIVQVHVVNEHTGQYLTKSCPSGPVDNVYISPLQTQVFDLHANRCITPRWEEQLFLLESPTHIFTPDTVLLFEIRDCSGRPRPSSLYNKLGASTVYRVYRWFKKFAKCTKLRHSLYVTVRDVDKPSPLSPTSKSKVELHSDLTSVQSSGHEVLTMGQQEDASKPPGFSERKPWQWTKLPGESCQVPNSKLLSLYGGPDGTLAAKFSPNGLKLAVAQHNQVSVFSIPEGTLLRLYNAHSGLIYSIAWHEDNIKFLTTSADRTVCVWSLSQGNDPVWILPHPCYVYDGLFIHSTIITCCYDGVLRVWKCADMKSADWSSCAELTDELYGHTGYVNALCYNAITSVLYSGDSHGVIIAWRLGEKTKRWCQERTIHINGLQDVVINSLLVYGRSCLIVHTQDSILRMIDAASGVVLQWYKGCMNDSMNTGCTLSPCRSLLFSASEDGSVYVWECHTGLLRGVYLSLGSPGPIALHYHPHDHMILIGLYSNQANPPLCVLSFVRGETGKSVGLHLLNETQGRELKPALPPLKDKKEERERSRGGSMVSTVPPPDKLSNIMHAMDQVLKSVC